MSDYLNIIHNANNALRQQYGMHLPDLYKDNYEYFNYEFTAVPFHNYMVNTGGGGFNINPPQNPKMGDWFTVTDALGAKSGASIGATDAHPVTVQVLGYYQGLSYEGFNCREPGMKYTFIWNANDQIWLIIKDTTSPVYRWELQYDTDLIGSDNGDLMFGAQWFPTVTLPSDGVWYHYNMKLFIDTRGNLDGGTSLYFAVDPGMGPLFSTDYGYLEYPGPGPFVDSIVMSSGTSANSLSVFSAEGVGQLNGGFRQFYIISVPNANQASMESNPCRFLKGSYIECKPAFIQIP
jgi:hypothetical protein